MSKDIIGRGAELGAIREFLAEIEVGPAALVLSGELTGMGGRARLGPGVRLERAGED